MFEVFNATTAQTFALVDDADKARTMAVRFNMDFDVAQAAFFVVRDDDRVVSVMKDRRAAECSANMENMESDFRSFRVVEVR